MGVQLSLFNLTFYLNRLKNCSNPFTKGLVAINLLLCLSFNTNLSAQNPVSIENALTGNPSTEWDVINAGDLSIQGFATEFSINKGSTVRFKINVTGAATDYTIRIYRLGYYQGLGAKLKATLGPFTGITQASGMPDPTGLLDCGNWLESASWNVPADAVSGIYIAKLIRNDNPTFGSSHITFVVRDDSRNADILFKTSDATWQAYNNYGGNSLYLGNIMTYSGIGRAAKVSYNRPFITRNIKPESFLFNAEYPMLRWLERNGYDVNYSTDLDFERDATPITPSKNKIIVSPGHDEYWSLAERNKVEAARDAGVHLAFFSGNEVYWKTRWENSIDGNNTPNRTLVCYKEGTLGQGEYPCGQDHPGNPNCDPLVNMWTGLWRFGQAEDGGRPENQLTGQMSWIEKSIQIEVPSEFKNLRFWRNTSIASLGTGQKASLTLASLGYEFNYENDAYSSYYPAGRILLSSTSINGDGLGNTANGKVYTHKLSLYRHASGALVFGAGTCQWSWGLDNIHDRERNPVSPDMQQATVNLLADMGVQPVTLQSGLVSASISTDFTAPSAVITSPVNGANLGQSGTITISGTISDIGGVPAGVEISLDGGATWRIATLTNGTNWSYNWIPDIVGPITIKVRGFDDSGNMQAAGAGPAPNVIVVNGVCPCKIFPAPTVSNLDPELGTNGGNGIVLGVKFRSSINGYITGIRFYKATANTGTHIGQLWQEGNLSTPLATATFTNETASGWQEVSLSTPVAITAGTTYVASYFSPNGIFSFTTNNFNTPEVTGPLTALSAPGTVPENGVFRIASAPEYPQNGGPEQRNFLVDVIFNTTTTCSINGTLAPSGPVCAGQEIKLTLTPSAGQTPYSVTLNNQLITGVSNNTEFGSGVTASDPQLVNLSIWPSSQVTSFVSSNIDLRELGLKFHTTMAGVITGIRFYKTVESGIGTFSVRLYDQTTGNLVDGFSTASITISTPGVSGWQQANFSQPITVQANKTYVASYVAPNGEYAESPTFFGLPVKNGPLTALANGTDGPNSVYKIGSGAGVPVLDGNAANYWVDVVFTATNIIRFSQITDIYGNACFRNNPNLQTLVLQPSSCSALPVSLIEFKLSILDNNVKLFWSTSSENNNRGFEIQRSVDGQNWVNIHFVNGAGNSQTLKKYEYLDINLKAGKYFYRLKQIDLSGDYKYSKVISANINGKQIYMLSQNYPNPANQSTTISYSLSVKNQVDMILYDMQGRQIKVLVHEVKEAGTHTIDLDTRKLGKGIYHYKMRSGNYSDVKRLLVE